MDTLNLPREIVSFINALGLGVEVEAARQAAVEYLEQLRRWGQDCRNTAVGLELDELEIFFYQLDEFRLLVLSEQLWCPQLTLPGLLEAAYDFAHTYRTVEMANSRLRFVEIPEVDALMVAAIALLNGNEGANQVLSARLYSARQACQTLMFHYEDMQAGLPQQVQGALEQGFELVQEGFQLFSHEDLDSIRRGTIRLREGAELLGHLLRWVRQRQPQSALPVGGAELHSLVEQLQVQAQAHQIQAALEHYYAGPFQQLLGWWKEHRDRLALPAADYASLVEDIDACLEGMAGSMLRPRAMLGLGGQLEALFQELQDLTINTDCAWGTALEVPVQAVLGAWQGVVPLRVLADLAPGMRLSHSPVEAQQAAQRILWVAQGAPAEMLLEALELLVSGAQRLSHAETVLSGLRCSCCNRPFNPDADGDNACVGGGAHQFYQVCA